MTKDNRTFQRYVVSRKKPASTASFQGKKGDLRFEVQIHLDGSLVLLRRDLFVPCDDKGTQEFLIEAFENQDHVPVMYLLVDAKLRYWVEIRHDGAKPPAKTSGKVRRGVARAKDARRYEVSAEFLGYVAA